MKRVLLTGGSRGIGRAIGEKLRAEGCEVVCPKREELDLRDPLVCRQFVERNPSDILVNCAGINEISWQKSLDINLSAPLFLSLAVAVGMMERKWGRIVNISSCFSLVSRPNRIFYSASKAGLNGLTRAAAIDFAPHVLVNAIAPGFVDTDMTHQNNTDQEIEAICQKIPLCRLAKPEEIAELVAFLVSEKNTYITGQVIPIDGGFLCQ